MFIKKFLSRANSRIKRLGAILILLTLSYLILASIFYNIYYSFFPKYPRNYPFIYNETVYTKKEINKPKNIAEDSILMEVRPKPTVNFVTPAYYTGDYGGWAEYSKECLENDDFLYHAAKVGEKIYGNCLIKEYRHKSIPTSHLTLTGLGTFLDSPILGERQFGKNINLIPFLVLGFILYFGIVDFIFNILIRLFKWIMEGK